MLEGRGLFDPPGYAYGYTKHVSEPQLAHHFSARAVVL